MSFTRLLAISAIAVTQLGLSLADTCSDVKAISDIDVSRPLSLSYLDEQRRYWSTACQALTPSCIIFPTNAQEVSTIIKVLNTNNETFAVKSGGHNPNPYFSSVSKGPLISTAKLDQLVLDPKTGIVRLGPGRRLDNTAAALDGTGWTFVGGRIGNTGVGGLILGGGLSYMSAQYGWAASSVLEYEVVLANGTVVRATKDQHSDLFLALKGGGNNFGVVTEYVVQCYRQSDIYGGNLVYLQNAATDKKILAAVRDFAEYNTDHKAAVIVTAERGNVDLIDTWIVFIFYDGPVAPPGTFANFTNAMPLLNTCKTQSYAQLIGGSNWVVVPASVVDIATETVPVPAVKHGEEVMQGIHAHWRNISGTTLLEPGIIASIAYQPFPKAIAREARKRSPDLIDAEEDGDKMIIEMNYSFVLQSSFGRMADTIEATYSGVRNRVKQWQGEGKLPDVYLPVFMNYGFFREDYWGRLKPESRSFAKRVAASVDPQGLFRERTGGWKP